MITIIPDTNALFDGEWLDSPSGRRLIALAEDGACLVLLPEVVVDELERQYIDKVDEASSRANSGLKRIRKDIDMGIIDAAFFRQSHRVRQERQRLLMRKNVRVIKTPESITGALVQRDLQRRRPFIETEQNRRKKSYGFRDAVIWETVLAILQEDTTQGVVYFVSNDNGFTDKNEPQPALHPHLLTDLDSYDIEQNRVIVVNTIINVVEAVEVAVAEAGAEEAEAEAASPLASSRALRLAEEARAHAQDAAIRAALVRVATGALEELVGEEISERLTYGGDYGVPDFVQFELPPAMESATIVAIDLESDFAFHTKGDTVTCNADLILSIEGATFKGDYSRENDEVQITGVLNNYYYETTTSSRVRAVILIDVELGPDRFEVYDIALEDSPAPASVEHPTSLQLDF